MEHVAEGSKESGLQDTKWQVPPYSKKKKK